MAAHKSLSAPLSHSAISHWARKASPMRWAARPVGAASATSAGFISGFFSKARRMEHTIVVFPVPGPPVITVSLCDTVARTASFCPPPSANSVPSGRLYLATESSSPSVSVSPVVPSLAAIKPDTHSTASR